MADKEKKEPILETKKEQDDLSEEKKITPTLANISSIMSESDQQRLRLGDFRKNNTLSNYEPYDFRHPDKFSKEQLRTLQMLHETFGRLAGTALSAFLRSPVNMELISLEQVPYEEYLRDITQSVFAVVSLPPLTGQAIFELELELVFAMIDRLLGGPGIPITRNTLTEIEQSLVQQMLDRIFKTFKSAWEGLAVINPALETIESNPQFVQIAPPNDIMVTFLFEVKLANMKGAMSVCVPYIMLKPISGKLSTQKWFVTGNYRQNSSSTHAMKTYVTHTHVNCSIQLGKAKLLFKDFLNLSKGDLVKLDRKSDEELTLFVNNRPKFFGKPALNEKKLVFYISDLYSDEE